MCVVVTETPPGVQHGDGALCEDASNDDGFPESARPRFTQRNQYTCVTEDEMCDKDNESVPTQHIYQGQSQNHWSGGRIFIQTFAGC